MRSLSKLLSKLPITILVLGAGAAFASNIAARALLDVEAFTNWAYLTTLASVFLSFSLLGTEQLIVRSSRLNEAGSSVIPESVVKLIASAAAIFALVFVLFVDGKVVSYRLGTSAVLMLASVGVVQVTYQGFRARRELMHAQVVMNGWRFMLLPSVAVIGWLGVPHGAELAFGLALAVGASIALSLAWHRRPLFRVGSVRSDANQVAVPFALSLGTLAVLNVIDRVVVERSLGGTAFSGYFYNSVVLSTPFMLLANYVGFSEAMRYKESYSKTAVVKDAFQVGVLVTGAAVVWGVGCYVLADVVGLDFNPVVWGCVLLVCVLRCVYAVASAAMGVRGSGAQIVAANLVSLSFLGFLWGVSEVYEVSLAMIVVGFVLAWSSRVAAYFVLLPRSVPAREITLQRPVVSQQGIDG